MQDRVLTQLVISAEARSPVTYGKKITHAGRWADGDTPFHSMMTSAPLNPNK